jgi:hypothetical protein
MHKEDKEKTRMKFQYFLVAMNAGGLKMTFSEK